MNKKYKTLSVSYRTEKQFAGFWFPIEPDKNLTLTQARDILRFGKRHFPKNQYRIVKRSEVILNIK